MLEHPYFCAADICWNLIALKILFKKALEKALENRKKKRKSLPGKPGRSPANHPPRARLLLPWPASAAHQAARPARARTPSPPAPFSGCHAAPHDSASPLLLPSADSWAPRVSLLSRLPFFSNATPSSSRLLSPTGLETNQSQDSLPSRANRAL